MNKRKASTDRNTKQKSASRRQSVISLHSKSNAAQQRSKFEKVPSSQNLTANKQENFLKQEQVDKIVEACLPKTRFSSQDRYKDLRSCSSPRIKNFPSEKIKKFVSPPTTPIGALIAQQNPYEAGIFYAAGNSEQSNNNGQGDATSAAPCLHQHRPPQNVQSVDQQQVASHQSINPAQMNPQSESTLPHQLLNPQTHRPFVPHGSHDHQHQKTIAVVRNSPRVAVTPQPISIQSSNQASETMDQTRSKSEEPNNALDSPNYIKQPIGGRNQALYRQTFVKQQSQLQPQTPMESNMSNTVDQQHLHNQNQRAITQNIPNYPQQVYQQQYHNQNQRPVPQNLTNVYNPQQVYQQLQQNMHQQAQLQQQTQMHQQAMNYQMRMMGNQLQTDVQRNPYAAQRMIRYNSGQGAMSNDVIRPASVPVSGNRMMATNPQIDWTKNNQLGAYSSIKAQLKPYSVEMVNNEPRYMMHQVQRPVQQIQQSMHQMQQPMQQVVHKIQQPMQQFAHNAQAMQQMQQPTYNQMSINPGQAMVYHQPATKEQHTVQQLNTNNLQPLASNSNSQNEKKKRLQFTVGMLRDQEKLLNTMKQQGVPFVTMKRQFDALLNEQRKQLEHLEMIQRQDDKEDVRSVKVNRRRKYIDEKPEWMTYLTPTRLSYLEMEKLREKEKREKENWEKMQQNVDVASQQLPIQPQTTPNYQMISPNWNQSITQQHPTLHPQKYAVPMHRDVDSNAAMMNYQSHQHAKSAPLYRAVPQPIPQQYNYQMYPQQQYYQEIVQQNQEQMHLNDQEQVRHPIEPSSLFKKRQYLNEIGATKRNNGLQDPEIAKKQLEELRANSESRGLEYLTNSVPKKPQFKLNGIQDRSETETEIQKRLLLVRSEPTPKRISANGLENSRNPGNPPRQRLAQLRNLEEEFLREYPRQRDSSNYNSHQRDNVQAERENGTVANNQQIACVQHNQQIPMQNQIQMQSETMPYNDKNPLMARTNVMPFKFDGNHPQHYQQMQQYYWNTKNLIENHGEGDATTARVVDENRNNFEHAGGDTYENVNSQMMEGKVPFQGVEMGQIGIHEVKTIGGVKFLARKQDYLPNQQQLVAPETLISNRYLQPPTIC